MTKPQHMRRNFLADESGAGAIEYSLVIALTALVVSVSTGGLGASVNGLFEPSAEKVEGVARCVEVGSNCKNNKK